MSHYAKTSGWANSFDLANFKVNPDLNACLGHIQIEYSIRKVVNESGPNLQLILLQPFLRKLRKTNFSHLLGQVVISGSKIEKTFFSKKRVSGYCLQLWSVSLRWDESVSRVLRKNPFSHLFWHLVYSGLILEKTLWRKICVTSDCLQLLHLLFSSKNISCWDNKQIMISHVLRLGMKMKWMKNFSEHHHTSARRHHSQIFCSEKIVNRKKWKLSEILCRFVIWNVVNSLISNFHYA